MYTLEKSSQMENFLTLCIQLLQMLTNGKLPHPAWLYASSYYKCMYMLEKSSQMENFLTQYNAMPSALINARTLEKSSQMKRFLTQHDSMHPHLRNAIEKYTHTKKILTNGKFPHPAWLYASSSYKCTYMLEKSSQMENFLTQHDSMPPALTNAPIR